MSDANRTEGELQFERYLDSMHYSCEFEKSYPGRAKKPDYTVAASQVFLADVKDFDPYVPTLGAQQVDVHSRIREKIQAGYKKFKEYKDFPCCVVLQNNGNPHVSVAEPAIVLGCMYGTVGFQVPIYIRNGPPPAGNPPAPTPVFTGDAQMTATKNRTISALLSLREVAVGILRVRKIRKENKGIGYDDAVTLASQMFEDFDYDEMQLGVIVWENAHARLPLSRELFRGTYDERFGLEDGYVQRIFCGSGMAELETT